jgi:hypothetical protein
MPGLRASVAFSRVALAGRCYGSPVCRQVRYPIEPRRQNQPVTAGVYGSSA